MKLLKIRIKDVIAHLPFRGFLLAQGALLPPSLKTRVVSRFFANLLECENQRGEIVTNLGIRSGYRIRLDHKAGWTLLFGNPKLCVSEWGALYLSSILACDARAFLDIGANRGYFTFFVWSATKGEMPIYFFEPNPKLYNQLVRNLNENGISGAQGFESAVAAELGEATFFVDQVDDASSTLVTSNFPSHTYEEVIVKKTSFDSFVREQDLRDLLVKVDIEGAEIEFLDGAREESKRIRYLIIEVLAPAIEKGFINIAKSRLGMEAYLINHIELRHSPNGEIPTFSPTYHAQYNWLFTHLSPAQLAERLVGTEMRVVDSRGSAPGGNHFNNRSAASVA